jgi:hypothetical protein
MDGINAGRLTLKRAWFDAVKCETGIEALRQYREDYDDRNKVSRGRPRHDWTSHTADAWRYLSMAWQDMQPKPAPARRASYQGAGSWMG